MRRTTMQDGADAQVAWIRGLGAAKEAKKTAAARFQNALRIMHSLDEVDTVLPHGNFSVSDFHNYPIATAIRMDAETWAKVYVLIEARQPK